MLDIEKITSQTRLAEYGSKINSIIDSVYLPDEDTIIIEDGKLKSRSIPFDTANGCAVVATGSEYPVVLNSELSIMVPNFSSGKYTVYNGDKAGVSLGTDYIEITKNGYYIFHTEVSFNAVGSSDTDILLIAYINDVGFTSQTGVVRPTVANPDFIGITNFTYFNAGDKIYVGYGGQVNQVVMATFGATLLRLPVTNEYQVSNSEYFDIHYTQYNTVSMSNSGDNITNYIDIPWNIEGVTNESPASLSVVDGIYLSPVRKGIGIFNFYIVIGVGDDSSTYDFVVNVIRKDSSGIDTVIRSETLSVHGARINSDIFNVPILAPINEGDSLFFKLYADKSISSVTYQCDFSGVILPSITDNVDVSKYADGVTIAKNDSNLLVAKDIAIGGDASDLASARGYIADELLPWYPGYFNTPLVDFNDATILGRYHVMVHKETTLNAPPILLFTTGTTSNDGMLIVEAISSATGISSVRRYRQTFMVLGSASKIWVRHQGTSGEWGTWREIIADTNIGDGIRVTNGILSVPEYQGADETSSGIAGLVPPALPAERNYPLVGSGEFSPDQTAQSLRLENAQLNEDDISYGSGFFWMDGANKRLQFRFIPGSDNANAGSDKHDYLEIIMVGRDSQGNFQKIEKSIYLNLSNFSVGLHEFTDGVETSYFARQPFGAACHAGAGIGQFMQLSGINIRLPDGGTWMYYHQCFTAAGVPLGNAAGFAAGGSTIANNYDPQTTMGSGWAWRIA